MYTPEQLNSALADRYFVERRIGEGGMATVYLARDVRHDRKVALKVLKPDLGAVVGVDRFLSEIRVTANLQHPNLLPLFDSGEAGGVLFYVMPFVEGESLRARLDRERQLAVDDAVRIASAVASALDYAHRQGVIHRDLKPENILLHDGQPLVADFGIALAVSNAGGNRITQTGLSLGTPQYMSPEQATGDRVIDARTDVYSLGAVTYEMLTGEPPHTGATSQAIIARVLTEAPRPIRASRPSVPPHVEAAVAHALEKLAPDRFATVKEFGEALTGARAVVQYSGTPTLQQPVTTVAQARGGRLRELVAWSLASIGIATAAWSVARTGRTAPPELVEFTVDMPDGVAITTGSNNAVVALSPDGSTMAFQGTLPEGDGRLQALYLRRLDDRTAQLIRGTEGGFRPTFSPDGSEILFQTANAIRRLPVRGGTSRVLVDSGGPASWGDNREVVYSDGTILWVVAEDGGTPRMLARPDTSRAHVGYGWPHVLPGSRAALITISVVAGAVDSIRLGVVSLPDGHVTELSPAIHGLNPRYSPSGHVLYATPGGNLLAVPFSTRALQATGTPVRVTEGVAVGPAGAAAFAVAKGGTVALLQTGDTLDFRREIVRVTRSGSETLVSARRANYESPRVSPDGRQVALTVYAGNGATYQTGSHPDIWRLDLRSEVLTRVTTDSASLGPAWSPDGDRIAHLATGDTVVRWQPVFRAAQPTVLARSSRPLFSIAFGKPNGHVAVEARTDSSRPETADILVAAADSPALLRPLLAESYAERGAALSPDEQFIAYTTTRTGTQEVYVRPFLAGGPEVQVSSGGGAEPVWSRDGRELFYRTRDRGHLMAAQLDAGGPTVARRDTLFRNDYGAAYRGSASYDVFPDGKSFVMLRPVQSTFVARSHTAPLVVLMNWRPRAAGAPAR